MVPCLFVHTYLTLSFESRFDLMRKYDDEVIPLEVACSWLSWKPMKAN
jgi:hypothetical protein